MKFHPWIRSPLILTNPTAKPSWTSSSPLFFQVLKNPSPRPKPKPTSSPATPWRPFEDLPKHLLLREVHDRWEAQDLVASVGNNHKKFPQQFCERLWPFKRDGEWKRDPLKMRWLSDLQRLGMKFGHGLNHLVVDKLDGCLWDGVLGKVIWKQNIPRVSPKPTEHWWISNVPCSGKLQKIQ